MKKPEIEFFTFDSSDVIATSTKGFHLGDSVTDLTKEEASKYLDLFDSGELYFELKDDLVYTISADEMFFYIEDTLQDYGDGAWLCSGQGQYTIGVNADGWYTETTKYHYTPCTKDHVHPFN